MSDADAAAPAADAAPAIDSRRADPDDPADATEVGTLLHDVNVEFGAPAPEPDLIAGRLRAHAHGRGPDHEPALVALLAGRPAVGLAVVSFRPNLCAPGPVATLDELYVRPHLRDRGIGTALLAACVDTVRARGATWMEIGVDGSDVDTMRFYERHGFSRVEPWETEPTYLYHREW